VTGAGETLQFYLDNRAFERAGAQGCSNSAYQVVTAACCDRQVVEDVELSNVYFDSSDLTKVMSLLTDDDEPTAACPLCRATNLFRLVPVEDEADVAEEWRWACTRA